MRVSAEEEMSGGEEESKGGGGGGGGGRVQQGLDMEIMKKKMKVLIDNDLRRLSQHSHETPQDHPRHSSHSLALGRVLPGDIARGLPPIDTSGVSNSRDVRGVKFSGLSEDEEVNIEKRNESIDDTEVVVDVPTTDHDYGYRPVTVAPLSGTGSISTTNNSLDNQHEVMNEKSPQEQISSNTHHRNKSVLIIPKLLVNVIGVIMVYISPNTRRYLLILPFILTVVGMIYFFTIND